VVQLVRHAAVPLHTYGAHEGFAPGAPRGRSVHVPTIPGASHTSQPLAQAVLQQTPSTQLLLAQSEPAVHTWPFFRLQIPFGSHVFAPVHVSLSSAFRTVVHAPVPPAHVWHVWHVWLHADWQHTPSTQLPVAHSRQPGTRQSAARLHIWPAARCIWH
jgi:hypothetical protein